MAAHEKYKQKQPNEYRVLPRGEPIPAADHAEEHDTTSSTDETRKPAELENKLIDQSSITRTENKELDRSGHHKKRIEQRDRSVSESAPNPAYLQIEKFKDIQPWEAIRDAQSSITLKTNTTEHELGQELTGSEQRQPTAEVHRESAQSKERGAKEKFDHIAEFLKEVEYEATTEEAIGQYQHLHASDILHQADVIAELRKDKHLEDTINSNPTQLQRELDEHSPREKLSLTSYQWKTEDHTHDHVSKNEDHERYNCYVPAQVAERLEDLGPLEPETVQYLNHKYEYIERHVERVERDHEQPHENTSEERPDRTSQQMPSVHKDHEQERDVQIGHAPERSQNQQNDDIVKATEHAEKLRSYRDDKFVDRSNRASMQIDELEKVSAHTIPAEYVQLVIRPDKETACYEIEEKKHTRVRESELPTAVQEIVTDQQPAQWKEHELPQTVRAILSERNDPKHHDVELPAAVQNIINGRDVEKSTNEKDSLTERQGTRSNDSRQKAEQQRLVIAQINRDLVNRTEGEIERENKNEPDPGRFVCVEISRKGCHILAYWTAHNWEEFWARAYPGGEPTRDCVQYMNRIDSIWHSWNRGLQQKRAELETARHQQSSDRHVGPEYEHDDLDR